MPDLAYRCGYTGGGPCSGTQTNLEKERGRIQAQSERETKEGRGRSSARKAHFYDAAAQNPTPPMHACMQKGYQPDTSFLAYMYDT